jgi:tyrosine-protein kinase Etk/Wzc
MTEHQLCTDEFSTSTEAEFLSAEEVNGLLVTVINVLTVLAYRKRTLAIITSIALIIGCAISVLLPSEYTAITKIMPPQQIQSATALMMSQLTGSGSSPLVAAAAGAGGFGLKNPNDIYLGLLSSRPIADAIIQRFSLAEKYRSRDMTAARKKLATNTKITSEKSGLISINVTDRNRGRAADIGNAYTAQLRILTKSLAVTEAGQRRLFYEEQLKRAKDDLDASEFAFRNVQQRRGLVQLDAQGKAIIEGLANLRAQVAAKEVQLQAVRSYSTENNPSVQMAERELSSLQDQIARLSSESHATGISNLGLGDVPVAGLEYLSAQHELQYRQVLFDLILKQYDAARLDEAKDAAVIQVVEPAIPPERRSSPKRLFIIGLLTAIGFLGGCGYVFTREYFRGAPETWRSLLTLKSALIDR